MNNPTSISLLQRYRWPLLLVLVLVAGFAVAFWPARIEVESTTVARGTLDVTVEDDGVTRVKEVYLLSAPFNGIVSRIDSEPGDAVTANDTVIARLRPNDPGLLDRRTEQQRRNALEAAKAAHMQAQAEVAHQEAELQLAQTSLSRLQQLQSQNFTSQAELDRARTTVQSLSAAVEQAKAALRQRQFDVRTAEAALLTSSSDLKEGNVLLKAPITGRVLRRLVESEQAVMTGTPLLELGDPHSLEIAIDFLSRDAVRITPGDKVEIRRWGGDGILAGQVRTVEPFGVLKVSSLGIEEQRVNVIIDFTDAPQKWSRLGHGYQVDAAVILWHGENVLKLPLSALFRQGNDWTTFAVDAGKARVKKLKVGHLNSEYAEILEGLAEGDEVIVNPGIHVSDGVRISSAAH